MNFLEQARTRARESLRRLPRRWVAGGAVAVALYAALGFWLVPAVAPGLVAGQLAHKAGRELTIAQLRFNPFTLRLQAEGVQLRDRDGSELLALGGLVVEAQWRSLLRRAWSFAEIRLAQPVAWVRIAPDGQVNFAQLVADFASDEPADPAAPLPRVVVERFEVAQGRVEFLDARAGYDNVIAPVSFDLQHFSTLPEAGQDHVFSARSDTGGLLRWKGRATLQPLAARGEVTLENVALPELAVYLKPYTTANIAAGRLDATLPYSIAYADGRLQARIEGARTQLRQLAVAQQGARDHFAALDALTLEGMDADWGQRLLKIGAVKAQDGRLAFRRDARGALDLESLLVQQAGAAAAAPAPAPGVAAPARWRVELPRVALERMALQATDETASPPLVLQAPEVSLHLAASVGQDEQGLQAQVSGAELTVARLALAAGDREPLKLAQASVRGASLDLAARRVQVDQVLLDGPEVALRRRADGQLDVLTLWPQQPAPAAKVAPQQAAAPWVVSTGEIALREGGLQLADAASGVELRARDIGITVQGAGSDLAKPLRFAGELAMASGGRIATKGQLVPAKTALQATVLVQDLALAPLQPLLAQHLRLQLAGGSVSARGRVLGNAPPVRGRPSPAWQYEGSAHVHRLALHEEDGAPFAAWSHLGTDRLKATVAPNGLDIPELRLDGAQAKLIINDDRSFNAARLLVRPPEVAPAPSRALPVAVAASVPAPAAASTQASAPAPAPSRAAAEAAGEGFPIRIRRVRLQDAKLDFTDLSLRPQFAAKIYELGGAINGLSSEPGTRSQIELDGRVDDFGLARVRGEVNAFAPRESTDIQLVFRNVDMVPASPYSMKFAGWRIAQGRISLDLDYKIKGGQLQGDNRIVFDKLTLGERVESPDAMKIPLQLALAILTDSEGRIDLGLPVSGSLDDPEFSYGAVIWKAVGNLLGKIVTSPFRALGAALGLGSGDGLEAIAFDPGSARLLPPEREKLKQVAAILAKREQLRLGVPGQFNEAADGAALRQRALRLEVARRAGVPVAAGEEPGPLDPADRAVRVALRELFTERFGKEALAKEREAAEQAAQASAAGASAPAASVPVWKRVGNWVQGEPQVADGGRFYAALQRRLEDAQALPADAVRQLGAQRAAAIVQALVAAGVAPERAQAGAVQAGEGDAKAVPVKLELAVR